MLWSSVVFAIDWRKYLCKTLKITCRHASNQQTRNTTYRNIQYCYLLWSRKKVQSIEITLEWNDSFIIWFRDTLHFIIYIRKNNTCMTMTHEHRNVNWLRLNRQSFYRNQKRQRVPIDQYQFRTIRKLIRSVSHGQVPYRYLDALPNRSCNFAMTGEWVIRIFFTLRGLGWNCFHNFIPRAS